MSTPAEPTPKPAPLNPPDPAANPTHTELIHRFRFHPATPARQAQHERVRREVLGLAHVLAELCPASRETHLAIEAAEQVMFWANAAIARHAAKGE